MGTLLHYTMMVKEVIYVKQNIFCITKIAGIIVTIVVMEIFIVKMANRGHMIEIRTNSAEFYDATTSTCCLIEEEKEPLVDKVLETSIHPAIGEAVSTHIENKTSKNIILQASTSVQIESSKDITTLATNKPTQTSYINIEQSSTPCYKAPDIFKEVIQKGNTDNKDEKAILDRIINLPDVVNDILSDWTLIITSENIAKTYWDVNSTQKYSGLTLPNIKTIIISNLYNECTLHEIGHIIDVENEWASNTNVFTNIYEKEKYGIGEQ